MLTIEMAVVGFVITMLNNGGRLSGHHGSREFLAALGLALVAASVLLSLMVVVPQLGRRKARRVWRDNLIYFGHLRRWDPMSLLVRWKHSRTRLTNSPINS